jgi:DNA-binding CsgD family transcriptional regulator
MAPYEVDKERARQHGLTERDVEVLCLVCGGMSSKEAGARLGIGDTTARNHLMKARAKLGAHTTGEACILASELGIIRRAPER